MTTSDPNMSASRGVPLCASKNESLSRWTGKFETRRHGGHVKAIFTVDVETNRLCPDTPIVLLALEQLILDGSHQVGTYDVEADDEIRSIHFEHLTVKFSMQVLVSVIRGGDTACSEEVVQILGCYRGEIDESRKTISLMGVPAYDGNHTHLGFFLP